MLKLLAQDKEKPEWTQSDLENWLLDDQEKAVSTADGLLRHLRFMEAYPGQPVTLQGTRYQFVLSGRLYYKVRKDVEKPGYGALQNDLKVLRKVGTFLGVPKDVWPVAPYTPNPGRRAMPRPEEVYGTLHRTYAPNAKRDGAMVNAWARHVLALSWGFGLRGPKEPWFLKADSYDPGTGIFKVVEPKKHYKERFLYVEPVWLGNSHSRLSLTGWLKWRDQLAPDSNALFPNPVTGKDFPTPAAFAKCFYDLVKPQVPWFNFRLARHWATYARIIDAGFSDTGYNLVAEWLGHDSADMTRDTYGPAARTFSKSPAYGKDWITR
ncbi:MAG: hypothetical protein ABR586_06450, partial [Thermoplasmatota archaeon]